MLTSRTSYRLALGLALSTALLLFLAIGAVGMIGDGGRPDRVYLAVFGVFVLGAALARLRPRGMALALAATALTQLVVLASVLASGTAEAERASVADLLGVNTMYAALFGASAWLFHRAAGEGPATA